MCIWQHREHGHRTQIKTWLHKYIKQCIFKALQFYVCVFTQQADLALEASAPAFTTCCEQNLDILCVLACFPLSQTYIYKCVFWFVLIELRSVWVHVHVWESQGSRRTLCWSLCTASSSSFCSSLSLPLQDKIHQSETERPIFTAYPPVIDGQMW